MVYCDGSDATVISNTACTIPATQLIGAPHSLPWGSQAAVKVIAYNSYGDSEESPMNSDVKLTALPADVTLSENMALRTPTQIGLTWSVGFIGGT